MTKTKLERLYGKAIQLQQEIMEIVDTIYQEDEIMGESLVDYLQDEKRLRS